MHNYLNLANRLRFSAHVAPARALSPALETARAFRGGAARCPVQYGGATGGGGNCGHHKAVTTGRGHRGRGGGRPLDREPASQPRRVPISVGTRPATLSASTITA